MTSEMIRCDSIEIPPPDPKRRSRSKGFAKTLLAPSIATDGQIQPIVVRPHPAIPGRYILVLGWHRLFAIHKVLRRDEIEAKVIHGMDEADAATATTVDHLWRKAMDKGQHLGAIREWHGYFVAGSPRRLGQPACLTSTSSGKRIAKRGATGGKANGPGPKSTPTPKKLSENAVSDTGNP